ncbi:hypothetical protein [Flavobacterium muglaense]|uniref:Uncharacterized protein n=1 Tax=Flavobacterium muglaense TaxID=2764716 RepID=A0A923N3H2_9FLAO|nr:hypothetical protein [Flavobacterium muglaense]MBC5839760.1 hypothetical protein [Flavobacterium muglaense]MBC5846287.1 hypothetical protein [Flavobacterium muglaense]
MKLRSYIFLIFNIGFFPLHSQETKTYSSENGDFVYQYYENSQLERIYNGTYKEQNDGLIITGQFKENLKSGNWKYITFDMDIYGGKGMDAKYEKDFKENTDTVYSKEVSGNYLNNMKNGVWTFKSSYDLKSKEYKNVRSFEFKNDIIIGNIDFSENVGSLNPGYKGQIDSLGYFTGLWHKKINTKSEDIIEFYKGFIIKELGRDLVTGDVYKKYIPNKEKMIAVIDKIILNKVDLYSDPPSFNYLSRNLDNLEIKKYPEYYYMTTNNMGYNLIDEYFKVLMKPWINISRYKGNMNTNFTYYEPKYLIKLIRTEKDFHSEKFNDNE